MAARMMRWDADGDGRLTRDEAPERMRDRFDRIDTNSDGFIDPDEIEAMGGRSGR